MIQWRQRCLILRQCSNVLPHCLVQSEFLLLLVARIVSLLVVAFALLLQNFGKVKGTYE